MPVGLPMFILLGTLRNLGQPKKAGLFGRTEVVDTQALDAAVSTMFQIAVGLGVSSPETAIWTCRDLADT